MQEKIGCLQSIKTLFNPRNFILKPKFAKNQAAKFDNSNIYHYKIKASSNNSQKIKGCLNLWAVNLFSTLAFFVAD